MSDLVIDDALDAELICGDEFYRCRCVKEPNHKGDHACDPDDCGGSWSQDHEVVALPHLGGAAMPFAFLFGGWNDDE